MNNEKIYCPDCGCELIPIEGFGEVPADLLRIIDYESRSYFSADNALNLFFAGDIKFPPEQSYEIIRSILDLKAESSYMLYNSIKNTGRKLGIPEKKGYSLAVRDMRWVYHKEK